MSYNKELEEILASIKNDKEKLNELLDNSGAGNASGVFKPLSRTERDAKPVITEEIKVELEDNLAPPEPPEIKEDNFTINESEAEPEVKYEAEELQEIIEESEVRTEPITEIAEPLDPPKPSVREKKEKKKKQKNNIKDKKKIQIPFKERLSALFKLARKKLITKQVGIILAIIVGIIAIVIAGVKIYDYSKSAYLKPYQEKYNITYPEGILEQFCDQYGKRQSTVGAISIEDNGTNLYVTNERTMGLAFAPKGTDVYSDQQFRAIEANNLFDIESIYSTSEGFVNASQKITFNTLFEKNEYQVIGAYYTNKIPEDDNGYVFPYNIYGNLNENSFEHFADSIKHRSLYNTGYEMTYDKNYISVYSDSDFMADFVFVIICAEIDKDFEKITNVAEKEKIHYPQVWYDAAGTDNPYIFSGHWYPEIITNPETQRSKKLTAEDYDFE